MAGRPPVEKPRLSAEQKKQNHIESERKRREAIRGGFERLADVVPDSQGQARSEGVVLANTVKHINTLHATKEELREKAQSKGMSNAEFEQHYRDRIKQVQDKRAGKEPTAPVMSTPTSKGKQPSSKTRPSSSRAKSGRSQPATPSSGRESRGTNTPQEWKSR